MTDDLKPADVHFIGTVPANGRLPFDMTALLRGFAGKRIEIVVTNLGDAPEETTGGEAA